MVQIMECDQCRIALTHPLFKKLYNIHNFSTGKYKHGVDLLNQRQGLENNK